MKTGSTSQDANAIILINVHDGASSDPLPWEAAFLAGKCFGVYRRRGGAPSCRIFTSASMPPWPAFGC